MSREATARQKLDDFLVPAGWAVPDCTAFNLSAARGIAHLDDATRIRQSILQRTLYPHGPYFQQ
jgi:hypothetical protein